jgi:hypothetical protein
LSDSSISEKKEHSNHNFKTSTPASEQGSSSDDTGIFWKPPEAWKIDQTSRDPGLKNKSSRGSIHSSPHPHPHKNKNTSRPNTSESIGSNLSPSEREAGAVGSSGGIKRKWSLFGGHKRESSMEVGTGVREELKMGMRGGENLGEVRFYSGEDRLG